MAENYQKKELIALMNQGANKREPRRIPGPGSTDRLHSLCRLQRAQSAVGVRELRYLHLPGMLRSAQRCASHGALFTTTD